MNLKWLPHWKKEEEPSPVRERTDTKQETERTSADEAQTASGLALPVSADLILESLREVEDPELGISIVDLGLVYGVDVEDENVRVTMTLTSPGCPIGPMLQTAVYGAVQRAYPSVKDVNVDLVWNPPWNPYEMASEEAKDMLGIW